MMILNEVVAVKDVFVQLQLVDDEQGAATTTLTHNDLVFVVGLVVVVIVVNVVPFVCPTAVRRTRCCCFQG